MVEKKEDSGDDVIVVPGKDKPAPVSGREWFPVKNNPLKPQQIRAWRLGEPGTGEPFPKDGTGEETVVEGVGGPISKRSSQFPADEPLKHVPTKGAITED